MVRKSKNQHHAIKNLHQHPKMNDVGGHRRHVVHINKHIIQGLGVIISH